MAAMSLALCAYGQFDTGQLLSKAKRGDRESQYAIAVMYENNAQTAPDWNEAAWWYRHAAEQGDIEAIRRLAWCYENGKGVSRDFDKALIWYLKAAEAGDSISQFQVGRFYREISQDYENSFSWFVRSADTGYLPAVNAVGECYRDGFGVPQNHYSAVAYFRKAAEKDDPDACFNLGRAYQYGFGVGENVSSARSYYEEALRLGHPAAAAALDRMGFHISGDIKGLMPGDTLGFERIPLDGVFGVNSQPGFKVIVSERDKFDYKGVQNHPQFYRMTFSPAKGKYEGYVSDGLDILIENGEYCIVGDTDGIYLSSVSGGDYDDPLIVASRQSVASVQREQASILRDLTKARKKGDDRKISSLELALSNHERRSVDLLDSARRSVEAFKTLKPSATFSIVDNLVHFSDYPLDDLRMFYDTMDSVAVESYYGKILIDKIMRFERVGVGSKMPFFALISTWHRPVSLNDLAGKYALIYFWDDGVASKKIDSEVVRLYEENSDRLEVVGVTLSEKCLDKVRLEDKYSSLLRHKWKDCEPIETNCLSLDMMEFGQAPYLILLSPEGEIIARGGASVLDTLVSTAGFPVAK